MLEGMCDALRYMSHLVPVLHHPVYSPFISLLEFKAIHGRGGYCRKVHY